MKKFIITLCGVLVAGTAMGASRMPQVITDTDILNAWNYSGSFSTNVLGKFTPTKYIPTDLDSDQKGTYDKGEGAIVAFIAREIYEHGGYFCATQIQAANENANDHAWLDYYDRDNDDKIYPCQTVCKPGWGGNKCSEQLTSQNPSCDATNFKENNFKATYLNKRREKGESLGRITTQVQVFKADHDYGSGSENKDANDYVLGVIEVKEHGLVVVPVKVRGRRQGMWPWYRSKLRDVYSNNSPTLLCATGYVTQDGDCVRGPICDKAEEFSPKICEGWLKSEYDSSKHIIKQNSSENCAYFVCISGGFKDSLAKDECIECPTDLKHYIDDKGLCQECSGNQIIGSDGKCTSNFDTVSKYDMANREDANHEKCWMKKSFADFKNCFGL